MQYQLCMLFEHLTTSVGLSFVLVIDSSQSNHPHVYNFTVHLDPIEWVNGWFEQLSLKSQTFITLIT